MQLKLPFNTTKPIVGEASIDIDKPVDDVFSYIGERFFENYPKWATDVIDFEALTGNHVFVGAKGRQVRKDNDAEIESIFTITEYDAHSRLVFQGDSDPYRHTYQVEDEVSNKLSHLSFRFELLEIEVFMRPFEKLIRYAIEDGAENTVENIKKLIAVECN